MSYRILARKYRPRTFAEVMGQDHIVRALSRALERERLSQAYLLVGPRGVGKTSTARILAKSVNCEKGPTVAPCLECPPCSEIEKGGDVDVVEIDGASNNGVDDVRALRERIHYLPIRDRRKIYIIDEVQRLSGPAFDALLKTLEEPPGHALFLFATTDPHKIPETIVSRCQTFEFRRLRETDIQDKLALICRAEGVEAPDEVLSALARGCRGGLRDAESMLDQVLAVADGAPTLDDLEMVAGLARPERWLDLFEAMERDDGAAVLRSVDEFLQRGGSERDLVEQAVDALRDLLHVVLLGADALGVEPEPERRGRMQKLASELGRDRIESLLGMLFTLESRIQQTPLAARALVDWTLLRGCRLRQWLDTSSLVAALEEGGAPAAPRAATAPGAAAATRKPEPSGDDASGRPSSRAPGSRASTGDGPAPETSVRALVETAANRRPTLGRILQEALLDAELRADSVALLLRPLSERDQAVVEDPSNAAFLRELPGSPGAWQIRYRSAARGLDDPLGEKLRATFGGREETP